MRALLVALVLVIPTVASAQQFADLGVTDTSSFTLSATPQYPAPGSSVTLSFLSGSLDLARAALTVSVNGAKTYQGAVQPVSVSLGRAGSITKVSAVVVAAGASYEQSLSIQPQDVVLIAEPVASAPPLYAGKPSVPLEGGVRVVAMANLRSASGAALAPSSLTYEWTVDGAAIANSSGVGKSALIVASPLQYRARSVSIAVTSADGTLVGGAEISLTAREPSMRIYENDPLLGIRFNRAISGEYSITDTESTLYAAPFSFPIGGGAPMLRWFLNGELAQTGPSITLRPTGSGAGQASLSLTASSGDYASATAILSILFGEKKGFNFFGL